MLISSNTNTSNTDFEKLISLTTNKLQKTSQTQNEKYLKLLGNKLEDEVFDVMCSCAKNTPFEGSIELVSGQKFPDIIANNYYGVEVKSTKQNHWKTTGNSVLESTRVEDIKRIYMLFGKIHNPIEFKCRLYQDCLYDVVVTHSPRYAIDMNLPQGNTIFDKIGIDYDIVRQKENPIKAFKEYYRKQLSEGQELWWIDNQEYQPNSIIFRIWNSLSKSEKDKFKTKGYAFFPEILSNKHTKFDNFTLWLSVKQRVICPNIRDLFTAGGKQSLTIEGQELNNLPKTLVKFIQNIKQITTELHKTNTEDFNDICHTNFTNKNDLLNFWLESTVESATTIYNFGSFNFKKWLNQQFTILTN